MDPEYNYIMDTSATVQYDISWVLARTLRRMVRGNPAVPDQANAPAPDAAHPMALERQSLRLGVVPQTQFGVLGGVFRALFTQNRQVQRKRWAQPHLPSCMIFYGVLR